MLPFSPPKISFCSLWRVFSGMISHLDVQYWRSGVEWSTDLALDSSLASIAACVIVQPSRVPFQRLDLAIFQGFHWPPQIQPSTFNWLPFHHNFHASRFWDFHSFAEPQDCRGRNIRISAIPSQWVENVQGWTRVAHNLLKIYKTEQKWHTFWFIMKMYKFKQEWHIFCCKCARLKKSPVLVCWWWESTRRTWIKRTGHPFRITKGAPTPLASSSSSRVTLLSSRGFSKELGRIEVTVGTILLERQEPRLSIHKIWRNHCPVAAIFWISSFSLLDFLHERQEPRAF